MIRSVLLAIAVSIGVVAATASAASPVHKAAYTKHTTIIHFRPFTKGGSITKGYRVVAWYKALKGRCLPERKITSFYGRAYWFDCDVATHGVVYGFANCTAGPPHKVACPAWHGGMRRIVVFKTKDVEHNPIVKTSPQAISFVLRDGVRCTAFHGTTFGTGRNYATYECNRGGWYLLWRANIHFQPWIMKAARYSYRKKSQLKDVHTVRVAKAWF